jgi:hypothetical protein
MRWKSILYLFLLFSLTSFVCECSSEITPTLPIPSVTPLPSPSPAPSNSPTVTESPTVLPTSIPTPQRIEFAPETTSIVLTGTLAPQQVDHYILRAQENQLIEVNVEPMEGIGLAIYGMDDTVLKTDTQGEGAFRGLIPSTQDYNLEVIAYAQSVSYTLEVIIPERISFEPGAIAATREGELEASQIHSYVLRAMAGQGMEISLSAPEDGASLIVYGVDGTVLQSGMGGLTSFAGTIPSTQDYVIDVAAGDQAVSYTLKVVIQ